MGINSDIDALLTALARLKEPEPADLASALERLPEPGTLPPPWVTWTLIGHIRHRERQLWVADIVRTRLNGDLSDLATLGASGHPGGVSRSGPVPGLPDWEYYFHGRGCCLTHGEHRESIDVDFWDDSAEYFDADLYKNYLESLSQPEAPEQRLRGLHPSTITVMIAIDALHAVGALTPLPGRDWHPYRIADEVMAITGDIKLFCAAWADVDRRVWLASIIGDWLAADKAAQKSPALTAITEPRANLCNDLWRQRLRRQLSSRTLETDALRALADLHSPDLDPCLENALQGSQSGMPTTALEIIGKLDDPQWCPRVYRLFSRVDLVGPMSQPMIWITSIKFLLRHNYRTAKLIRSLAKAGGIEVGEAVLLSLKYAPELALPLIRKALLADIPICRTQVAAILALIDSPWSQRELLTALEASDDQDKTAYVRAALLASGDRKGRKAVLAWEKDHPHESENGSYSDIDGRKMGPFYSMHEGMLRDRTAWVRYEMESLQERVAKLKHIVPPEPMPPSHPWWKFWAN